MGYWIGVARLFCFGVFVILVVSLYQQLQRETDVIFPRTFCILPSHPLNGWWSVKYDFSTLSPNTSVKTGTILQVYCNESYILSKENASICIDGNWFPPIGECLQTCRSLYSTPMMKINCVSNDQKVKNCENPVQNTRAEFFCPPYYEDERRVKLKAICNNGRWSDDPPKCVPICGRRKSEEAVPLIINGFDSKKGEFPWQVAIYRKKKFLCGGTLIHERLILTAAHCVKTNSESEYSVVVGNLNTDYYSACKEIGAQSSEVYHVSTHSYYQGSSNYYYADIAAIVPKEAFKLSETVLPICIDWTREYEKDKTIAVVTGFGYIEEDGTISDSLKSLNVPIVDRTVCKEKLINDREFFTDDKFCAGYINKSKSPCRGDSGGGLVFNHMGRYHLIGIVSITTKSPTGGCNSQAYTYYTHVSKYLEMIEEYYQKYKPLVLSVYDKRPTPNEDLPSSSSTVQVSTTTTKPVSSKPSDHCILPNHPKNGKWKIHGFEQHKPGNTVKIDTIIKVTCNSKYKLDGDNMIICEKGSWSSPIGQCLMVCPTLNTTNTITFSCFYKMGEINDCIKPISGASAQYFCAKFYEDLNKVPNRLYCRDSKWMPSVPRCVPRCGHKVVNDLMSDKNEISGNFPWVVAIYGQENLICMGTLLSEKLVVTSAECFKNKSVKKYTISAGQYFQNFSDAYIQLQNITNGEIETQSYLSFILLKKPFQFSNRIQPVCFDEENLKLYKNKIGYMSGWSLAQNNSGLKMIETEFNDINKCREIMPKAYINITDEKLCIKHTLNDTKNVTVVGGGIFVQNENKFYIVGVLDNLKYIKESTLFLQYTPISDENVNVFKKLLM